MITSNKVERSRDHQNQQSNAGCVLQVRRKRLTYASSVFSHDYDQARTSLSRLAELDPRIIALAHFPPWTTDCRAALRGLADAAAG